MPTVPESTKTSLAQKLTARARTAWPQLAGLDVRYRGQFAYIDGELPDSERIKLMRLRYGGSASTWGFALSPTSTKTPSCPPAASPAPPKKLWTAPAASQPQTSEDARRSDPPSLCVVSSVKRLHHHPFPGHTIGQQVSELFRDDEAVALIQHDGRLVAGDHCEFQLRCTGLQGPPFDRRYQPVSDAETPRLGTDPHRPQLACAAVPRKAAGHRDRSTTQQRNDVVGVGHFQARTPLLLPAAVPVRKPSLERLRCLAQRSKANFPPQRPVAFRENAQVHHGDESDATPAEKSTTSTSTPLGLQKDAVAIR